jgi:hypothetical protein
MGESVCLSIHLIANYLNLLVCLSSNFMPAGLLHLLEDLGESDSCLGDVMKGPKKGFKKSMGEPAKLLWEMMKETQNLTALSSAQVNDVQI